MNANEPLPILAKSSRRKITLAQHTQSVCDQAAYITRARPFACHKYRERTGGDLSDLLQQSAKWHDEGKRHKKWQTACQLDYLESVKTGKDCGSNLRRAGIRHELASLSLMQMHCEKHDAKFPLIVRAAIAAHHRKLSHRHKDRWHAQPSFESFWSEFVRESNGLRTSINSDFERAIERRYAYAGVRSLLQLADHRASASEEDEALPPLESFAYEFPHKDDDGKPSYRGVQSEIRKCWDESFSILRAPTGAGKTDAALLWAQRQIECGRADRLVIAMPTRFTANALAINAANSLSATGLYHSSALHQRTKDNPNPPRHIERFIDKEQDLARRLESPVTVTTIDHLCIALTGTREAHHATFFSLAHACLVIDEADFYDDFTQQNIVTLLRALRTLNVPVLLMSATVPESAREIYKDEATGVMPTIYEDLTDGTRPRCRVTRFTQPALAPEDYAGHLERALQGEPTIIYVNTVRRAQDVYRWFRNRLRKPNKVTLSLADVVLYHSRYTEPHKVKKEAQLLEMLGQKAWKDGTQRGVAILTQIGEISVNISADFMISELCPIDRLAQRAGRLARFRERADNKKDVIGELIIIEPHRINKKTCALELNPAPYGHFTNGQGWQASEAFTRSRELLEDGDYSAQKFVDLTNRLYPKPNDLAAHVRDNKRALENCAVINWLILPQEQVGAEEDDERTKDWQSRDIPFQSTVYADFKISNFDDEQSDEIPTKMSERRRFELRHGVKCHTYEYTAARQQEMLEPLELLIRARDPEIVWLVREPYYSFEMGLSFSGADAEETSEYE